MTEKLDLRIRMTQKLLTDALSVLMIHKPFDELSVVDICEEAQVHRTTFYKHFDDKQNLLEKLFDTMQETLDTRCRNIIVNNLHHYYVQISSELLSYISQNFNFFMHGVFSEGNESVQLIFHKTMVVWLQRHFETFCNENKLRFSLPVTVIAEYATGSLISLTIWWLRNNMFVSINEVISYVDALSANSILQNVPEKSAVKHA